MKVKLLSRVQLSETPWTAAHQAPLSMGFSRSKKGNAYIRAALYMPALSAAYCNRQMNQTYMNICDKHPDTKMIGVTAIMRKMLLLIYSLWKSGEEYDETRDS